MIQIKSGNTKLTEEFTRFVINKIKNENTTAIVLFGSYARGTANSTSDIDFTHYVKDVPEDSETPLLFYHGGKLVSVVMKELEEGKEDLTKPQNAVWVVPYLQEGKALYDPEGAFEALQKAAVEFQWEPLQKKANDYTSQRLMKFSEEAYKLSTSIEKNNEEATVTETIWLILGLPFLIAVQKGIFLENETKLPIQVQKAVGADSNWSKYYRSAAGLETPVGTISSIHSRGVAALSLYKETVEILRPVILQKHIEIINTTLSLIQ